MNSEIVPYRGREILLQSSNETVLQQLRDIAVHGGVAALTAGLGLAVRVITLSVDMLTTGYYRVRVMIEQRQTEFEVARILGMFEIFQLARNAISSSGWDADLQDRAREDLDRALERRRIR